MKKIINILLATLVLTGVSTVSAHADETYAMVNPAGVVTNVIVCSSAICGPGGAWGGKVPSDLGCIGCIFVLQSPSPTGGIFKTSPTDQTPVTYNSDAKTFTKNEVTWSAPTATTEVIDTTTVTVVINPDGVQSNPATISATEGVVTESQIFTTPQTRVQIEESVQNKSLLQRRLDRIYVLLRGWVLD